MASVLWTEHLSAVVRPIKYCRLTSVHVAHSWSWCMNVWGIVEHRCLPCMCVWSLSVYAYPTDVFEDDSQGNDTLRLWGVPRSHLGVWACARRVWAFRISVGRSRQDCSVPVAGLWILLQSRSVLHWQTCPPLQQGVGLKVTESPKLQSEWDNKHWHWRYRMCVMKSPEIRNNSCKLQDNSNI